MSKCCDFNTCSELYSSMCVLYTGGLVEGSYITLPDCNATLNDVVGQVDTILKELKDNDGVLKDTLTQYACSFTNITNLINATVGTKSKTSDTVIALLRTLCDLQARINVLENASIYSKTLTTEIQLMLSSRYDCFNVDPCDTGSVTTLEDLLKKIILKLCP